MIRGNTSDFIGHPLPKNSISDPHMGPPTTLGPRIPHHLNPALITVIILLKLTHTSYRLLRGAVMSIDYKLFAVAFLHLTLK